MTGARRSPWLTLNTARAPRACVRACERPRRAPHTGTTRPLLRTARCQRRRRRKSSCKLTHTYRPDSGPALCKITTSRLTYI